MTETRQECLELMAQLDKDLRITRKGLSKIRKRYHNSNSSESSKWKRLVKSCPGVDIEIHTNLAVTDDADDSQSLREEIIAKWGYHDKQGTCTHKELSRSVS
jgi:hypothetical protein